jgi:hypothetical protein
VKLHKRALVTVAVVALLAACGGSTTTDEQPSAEPSTPSTEPDTSQATCTKFREVSAGAFGESLTRSEVEAGLKEVGVLGKTAREPTISRLAVQAGEEADARALITGEADKTLDALADACNEAFPI